MVQWLLCGWATVACLSGIAAAGRAVRSAYSLRLLSDENPRTPQRWPRLSLLVPARDEAASLRQAMGTLLAQDYPEMEIVLVDDRSTDGTAGIVDELAARDSRVTSIHIRELPEGWLGKNHALEVARKKAAGEWLLFADADVHFAAGTLRKAVACCLAEERDNLIVLPVVHAPGFWHRVALTTCGYLFSLVHFLGKAGRSGSRNVVWSGAFHLVRAAKLEQAGGLSDLRMNINDDVALSLLLHRVKSRSAVFAGKGLIAVTWYPSLSGLLGYMNKTVATLTWRYPKVLAVAFGTLAVVVGPVLGLLLAPAAFVRPLVLGAYVLSSLSVALVGRRLGWPAWSSLFLPAGLVILVYGLLRAAFSCWRCGAVAWRGTWYPLETLRSLNHLRAKP